jgi:hypothetical protein
MFKKIVEFFTGKKTESNFAHPLDAVTAPNVPQAPYKVPEPAATTPIPLTPANEPPKCGCGRSSTGLCVGLHKLSPEAWAAHPDNPATVGKIVAAPAQTEKKKRTFVKKPAAPKAAAKPVAKAAAIKAPAKPRAKKPQ